MDRYAGGRRWLRDSRPNSKTQRTEEPDDEQVSSLRYEIASYPADYTLRVLNDQIVEKQLVIPDFQRNYVWSQPQASKLIESFLLGLPVPEVFLYKERASQKLLVIDGQQRLGTIALFYRERFINGETFHLRGVDERWEGKIYSELGESDRLRLDNSTLRSIVIQQLDPDDHSSVYLIFERLNTGGTQLNAMEIRRAQFPGGEYAFLEELNLNPSWRELIGRAEPDRRLKDVELVLRVLALAAEHESYKKPMKTFLNSHMITLQKMTDKRRSSTRTSFDNACSMALGNLGPRPFNIRGPLNVAALDSVLGILAQVSPSDGDELAVRYKRLLKDEPFLSAIERATSDEESVERRFARATTILLG